MNHCGTEYIETERLILRRFKVEDAEAMYKNWASNNEVTKFLMWTSHKDVSESRKILEEWINNYSKNDFYQWAITLKKNGKEPIGSISVVSYDDTVEKVEIGYCIGEKWWHRGITSEALEYVIKFLFHKVNVQRIASRHDSRNMNSGGVMKKCGMKYEGTLRKSDWTNQGICDACYYSLLKSEYNCNLQGQVRE